ncbi:MULTISPECIES: DUF2292 domain-containing protein [Latilactobacillus]|uniref:DUF2292 domain-containing protein n=1 Tax=Latilactobacillus curvatus TaxID=28038 RepID=A0AAJ5RHD6_LATCU|nr:DUF2292 domain-containing protein [Latilactobacillus curvatus]MCP8847377.1 YezD family protein [Latilactobacillus curvatus]MCP8850241.1 YezD family protein [Latilactobacillus curvatus]MCP8861840.1 YezD family protein [Latilactobacillus curvatus]MCP8864928.1 YezD family protein [Latilactobacillus curvatus]MCP8868273.1 YezD family protein [Latilactobacillus curvatus]
MVKIIITDQQQSKEYQLPSYGSLTVTTQNNKVVFIERTDKTKLV